MELVRGLHNLRPKHRGCVAAIGGFDGVHRGHQAIIHRLREHGLRLGLPTTLVTFEPLPREVIDSAQASTRLTRFRDKYDVLADLGLERLLVARFDSRLRSMSATRFVEQVLAAGLGAQVICVGDDFRFGAGGRGNVELLREMGRTLGFAVDIVSPVNSEERRVSSTDIRTALASGDMATAERLLGRPFHTTGRVTHGNQLGRRLGYPTANLKLHWNFPMWGIFAVRAAFTDGVERASVASIGTRPTVNGTEPLLEVHIFDYSREFYGELLRVEFVAWLREERKFDTLDELVTQISEDARRARAVLAGIRRS